MSGKHALIAIIRKFWLRASKEVFFYLILAQHRVLRCILLSARVHAGKRYLLVRAYLQVVLAGLIQTDIFNQSYHLSIDQVSKLFFLSVCLCLSSLCLSVCLFVCLSVCLSVGRSVCLCLLLLLLLFL